MAKIHIRMNLRQEFQRSGDSEMDGS